MKAEELRIGSLIYDNELKPTTVVEITDYDRIAIGNDRFVIDLHNTEPIPLTEEWLLKFGFNFYQLADQGKFFAKDHVEILQSHDFKQHWIFGKDVKIDFVHQLQNLYFVLTGEELEIKF